MSAYGTRTAVISLGVSCQTSWQIDRNLGLLSDLVGEPLHRASSPFDWLIMPPMSFASWMRSLDCFPASADDIVAHPNFYWPEHNLHFWHEFTRDGVVALHETFDDTRSKFEYLFRRFLTLRGFSRCVFFVSNTQSNLDVVRCVSPRMDFRFTHATMAAVVAAVRAGVGPMSEVHFVTRHDGADVDPDPAFNIHRLGRDAPEVLGDDEAWADVFRAALLPGALAQSCAA